MLIVKTLLAKMLTLLNKHNTDYITSEGTSGGWRYRRWSSGIDECWYDANPSNYTCATARGNMYAGNWISFSFPITFSNEPSVTASVTLTTDAYVVLAQVSSITTTGCKVRIVSGSSIAQNNGYIISIHASGA